MACTECAYVSLLLPSPTCLPPFHAGQRATHVFLLLAQSPLRGLHRLASSRQLALHASAVLLRRGQLERNLRVQQGRSRGRGRAAAWHRGCSTVTAGCEETARRP